MIIDIWQEIFNNFVLPEQQKLNSDNIICSCSIDNKNYNQEICIKLKNLNGNFDTLENSLKNMSKPLFIPCEYRHKKPITIQFNFLLSDIENYSHGIHYIFNIK